MAKIVLADDHALLRNGLAGLLKGLGHSVLFEANNGKDLIAKLHPGNIPEILMLDINMPEMDGYETARWMKQHHPEVKILVLSMYDNENAILSMLKCGARGYILKDSDPSLLRTAIQDLVDKGFFYSELVSGKLLHAISKSDDDGNASVLNHLNEREKHFLKFACTEMTYKEIAEKMFVSPRTVDGYRDALFEKLEIKTRVGLAIYAIRQGLVDINK